MEKQVVRLRLFTIVDYLEEEKYLSDMHKKGYKLVQVFGRFSMFLKGAKKMT